MSEERDPKFPQPPRGRRVSFATGEQRERRIDARIFAELLPRSAKSLTPARLSPGRRGRAQPDGMSPSLDSSVPASHSSVIWARKETLPMKVYRTESPYYFSSRQLLPVGSVVFFHDKLSRYVHPTDGILLDPHPRLELLSETESQELEERWRDALSRY